MLNWFFLKKRSSFIVLDRNFIPNFAADKKNNSRSLTYK